MTICFLFKAAATRNRLERRTSGCRKCRDMYATEYLYVSGRDRRRRGLSLPKRVYAARSLLRNTVAYLSSISSYDLVPWWRMAHRGRSLRILWAQVSARSRSRPRHYKFSVKFIDFDFLIV